MMRMVNVIVLATIFSSCSSKSSRVEKLAISFFKSETLDPDQFEIIMIETTQVTERDIKVNQLKESIQEENKKVENWKALEKFKANPENANIYGVSNYSVVYGDSFDGTRERVSNYQSEYKREPESSYTKKLREDLLSDIESMQRLFCSDEESGTEKVKEYEKRISNLNNENAQSPISKYEVKLRFYAMNRLGIRGITDARIEIYPDEVKGLVLGLPKYGEL